MILGKNIVQKILNFQEKLYLLKQSINIFLKI